MPYPRKPFHQGARSYCAVTQLRRCSVTSLSRILLQHVDNTQREDSTQREIERGIGLYRDAVTTANRLYFGIKKIGVGRLIAAIWIWPAVQFSVAKIAKASMTPPTTTPSSVKPNSRSMMSCFIRGETKPAKSRVSFSPLLSADDTIDNESTAYQHNGNSDKKKNRHVFAP